MNNYSTVIYNILRRVVFVNDFAEEFKTIFIYCFPLWSNLFYLTDRIIFLHNKNQLMACFLFIRKNFFLVKNFIRQLSAANGAVKPYHSLLNDIIKNGRVRRSQ
ncbi:MAG TPA: hypothetical protein DHU65_02105 [Clostridiales bacterium]|nr:hypothetical protein [Clostridiales bacterium]